MKDYIQAITALVIDSSALTGGYDLFDSAGLPEACSIIRVVNASDTAVGVSYDAVDTHEFLPAGASLQLNLQANSRPNNHVTCLAKGTKVSLKGVAGVGNIYLIGYYQK